MSDDNLTTWRELLRYAMAGRFTGEADPGPVIAYAPDEAAFDIKFDDGYGGTEGPDVLAWTDTFVYFPVCYDGAESIDRAPRNPRSTGQTHVGGG